jgi:hypothetical protein
MVLRASIGDVEMVVTPHRHVVRSQGQIEISWVGLPLDEWVRGRQLQQTRELWWRPRSGSLLGADGPGGIEEPVGVHLC